MKGIYRIPEQILADLEAWKRGQHPYAFGSFVTAVLANDLMNAFAHADDRNRDILADYAEYLYHEMPDRTGNPERDCWGSYEAVAGWIRSQRATKGTTA